MGEVLEVLERSFLSSDGEGAHSFVLRLISFDSEEYVVGNGVDDDGCENQCNVQGVFHDEAKCPVECIHNSVYNRSDIHGVLLVEKNIRFSGG